MSNVDLQKFMQVCEGAVRAGGQVIQDWVGRTEVRKKGPADLVTQADFASQEAVRRIVLGEFPNHCLLGEEADEPRGTEEVVGKISSKIDCISRQPPPSALPDARPPRAEYRWIVDPLDGTTNYVHGVPFYCVSLALERNGELLVGAVYDPVQNECFTAVQGQGARLNGHPIHASSVTQLSDALAVASFPPNVSDDSRDLKLFLAMIPRCQAIRRSGSSALNLCFIAAGRFDLFWSFSTHIWDVAAGILIIREAGGLVTSPTGGDFSLEEAHFLAASTPKLHAQALGEALAINQ
jgi:myo-inositol-1(or 4)-monophosphatase